MSKPNGGKLSEEGLELVSTCDICHKNRGHGSHKRCSRIRQERYRKEARP
ncbi:hypothetical protein [Metapseudomonas sp. CR1201]